MADTENRTVANDSTRTETIERVADELEDLSEKARSEKVKKKLRELATELRLALSPGHGEDQPESETEGEGMLPTKVLEGTAARLTIEIFR